MQDVLLKPHKELRVSNINFDQHVILYDRLLTNASKIIKLAFRGVTMHRCIDASRYLGRRYANRIATDESRYVTRYYMWHIAIDHRLVGVRM